MTDLDSPDLEGFGLAEDEALGAALFGVDEKGREHRFHRGRASVIVTKDGEVLHVEQLARDQVGKWVAYIRDGKCGWADCWWFDTGLAAALGRSFDADEDDPEGNAPTAEGGA